MKTNRILTIATATPTPFPYFDINFTKSSITASVGASRIVLNGGDANQVAQIEDGDYLLLVKSTGQHSTHILTRNKSVSGGNYTLGLRADTPILYATPTAAYLCKRNHKYASKRMTIYIGDRTTNNFTFYVNDQQAIISVVPGAPIAMGLDLHHPVILEPVGVSLVAVNS